jgi:hypothetical protein
LLFHDEVLIGPELCAEIILPLFEHSLHPDKILVKLILSEDITTDPLVKTVYLVLHGEGILIFALD